MTKERGEEERVYLASTSILLFITKGKQDRQELKQGRNPEAEAIKEWFLLAYS